MLRSRSFFDRFQELKTFDTSHLKFIESTYVKDDHGIVHRVDRFVEVPPVEGSVDDYSLNALLSSGVQLKPSPINQTPSLDDLSLLRDEIESEIINS